MGTIAGGILAVLCIGYLGYRFRLVKQSAQAQRAGDFDRAGQLKARGFWSMWVFAGIVFAALMLLSAVDR